MKASTEMKLRRLQSVGSGVNSVVFIRTLGIESRKLVHHILQDVCKTKRKESQVILPVLPISGTCKETSIQKTKWILPIHQYTVVVEIVKVACCLRVVKDYTLFRKYNLHSMVRALRTWHSLPQSGQRKQEIGKVLNWNPVTDQIKMTQLYLKGHSGTAGQQSSLVIHGADFSTKDADNDNCLCKCALMLTGGTGQNQLSDIPEGSRISPPVPSAPQLPRAARGTGKPRMVAAQPHRATQGSGNQGQLRLVLPAVAAAEDREKLKELWNQLLSHANKVIWQISDNVHELAPPYAEVQSIMMLSRPYFSSFSKSTITLRNFQLNSLLGLHRLERRRSCLQGQGLALGGGLGLSCTPVSLLRIAGANPRAYYMYLENQIMNNEGHSAAGLLTVGTPLGRCLSWGLLKALAHDALQFGYPGAWAFRSGFLTWHDAELRAPQARSFLPQGWPGRGHGLAAPEAPSVPQHSHGADTELAPQLAMGAQHPAGPIRPRRPLPPFAFAA
ncbi:hypothetical protein QTO34_007655 [Cnephaeus nilssonii]|uniref:Uncharacterized protein n=1 Tax=Cnephaeus nilssonii TaxID=3371016 RepID=A0AA40LHP2_CNENI|nr:hypothetical protein QTO34_007655 [Eptesicus nilssonii]